MADQDPIEPGAQDPPVEPGYPDPAEPGAQDPPVEPGYPDPAEPGAQDPPVEPGYPDPADPGAEAGEHAGTVDDGVIERPPLQRSTTDRVIAGVAGGLGAYFEIDPVLVRIGFIVLTFLGGAGPFLYLIGWLAIPREENRSVVGAALAGDSPHRFRSIMAVGLIALGLLVTVNLSGDFFRGFAVVWSAAPYFALLLIAAGVALVLWPGSARRNRSAPARPPTPPPAPPSTVPPSPTAAGPEWSVASPPGPPLPAAAASVSSAKRRRGRSLFGTLTVAALLVYAGAAVMLDRLDAIEMDIGVFFAIALAITGVGLFVSAFARPARGLILLGVMLSAPLLLFAGAGVPWGTGIGEVRVSVADTEELADEYRHGFGRLVVDLRNLDSGRTDHSVDMSLSVGEMLVYVPDNILTTTDIRVGAGNLRVLYGGPASGRSADLNGSRDLLEELWVLPYSDVEDLDDYLEAYERRYPSRIRPEQRQALARLFAEERAVGGANRVRDTLALLLDEARLGSYPRVEGDDGIGISRTVVLPVAGEPEGVLHLDLDVGVGEVEVITVPAPTQRSASQ